MERGLASFRARSGLGMGTSEVKKETVEWKSQGLQAVPAG